MADQQQQEKLILFDNPLAFYPGRARLALIEKGVSTDARTHALTTQQLLFLSRVRAHPHPHPSAKQPPKRSRLSRAT
jgi:hypothetical protein